jgi:sodium transport system permease protein
MHTIATIYRKELLDTTRDRRTLLVMVVVPLLVMPALLIGLGKVTVSQSRAAVRVAVAGQAQFPQLVALLRQDTTLKVVPGTDPVAMVKGQKADVGVVVGRDFAARLRADQPAPLTIVSDDSQLSSSAGAQRVSALLQVYQQAGADQRLRRRGIDPQVLRVVAIATKNVASPQAMSGLLLSFILPALLVTWSITGGMYAAIDMAAGEKERNTLEALLMTPATKLEVTLGKLLAVSTVAFIAMTMAIGSLYYSLQRWGVGGAPTGGASVPLSTLALMLLVGLLMAVAFSSLELALSIFARSFKEAQNYITPLYLLAFVPVVIVQTIPTLRPPLGLFLIPAVNAVLVFKEALIGRADPTHVLLAGASLLVFAALAVAASTYVFTREQVLFKA